MKPIAGIVFAGLTLSLTAQAASFDCGKAQTKVEKLICANSDLSKRDKELAQAYVRALKQSSDPEVKTAQKIWLKERNACTEATCLKRVYENRLQGFATTKVGSVPSAEAETGILLSSSYIPTPYCETPLTADWARQCSPPDLPKLETELAQVYAEALARGTDADKIRSDQKTWTQERNKCAKTWIPAQCLDYIYRKRILRLRSADAPQAQSPLSSAKPRGEYFLSRSYDISTSFCQDFTRNLNQFRYLSFDECNTRLSPKFPEFSRPQWEAIPFDLGIAEEVVKGSIRTQQEELWRQWLAKSEPLRQKDKIRLWRTRIDVDGDGKLDTIIRMDPEPSEIAKLIETKSQKPSPPYGCDYNFGALYLLVTDTTHPETARDFNGAYFQDIIYNSANGTYYLVSWSPDYPADGLLGPHGDTVNIGAASGVTLASLRGWPVSYRGDMCKIDWVVTGRYKPPKRPARR